MGNIRHAIGLPAYDRWDEYRVERELSNMVADGKLTADEGIRAMIEKKGPMYDEAVRRASIEYSGGSPAALGLKLLGLPTYGYPTGEAKQRSLRDDYARAWKAYDEGDVGALTKFFDAHPEYETRLALWDKPEEKMRKYLVDHVWDKYNQMPKLWKDDLKEALGQEWKQLFLDKETRNTDAIPTDTLQMWLKLMGGDPPGTLNSPTIKIDFADSDIAWRAEQFYNLRSSTFPSYYKLQNEYYSLDKAHRKEYLFNHKELKNYWDWRRDFFMRNPDIVPYVDDKFKFPYSEEEKKFYTATAPNYSIEEWNKILGSSVVNVLKSGEIPAEAEDYVDKLAEQLGMSVEDIIADIEQAQK
jgi:hypothetical protein